MTELALENIAALFNSFAFDCKPGPWLASFVKYTLLSQLFVPCQLANLPHVIRTGRQEEPSLLTAFHMPFELADIFSCNFRCSTA